MTTSLHYLIVRKTKDGKFSTIGAADPQLHISLNQVDVNEPRALQLAGDQGWELVTIIPQVDGTSFYYFKRFVD